jgi:hypothetical protein
MDPIERANISPEIQSYCFYRDHVNRFYLKTETESSLRNIVLFDKDRTMDNV